MNQTGVHRSDYPRTPEGLRHYNRDYTRAYRKLNIGKYLDSLDRFNKKQVVKKRIRRLEKNLNRRATLPGVEKEVRRHLAKGRSVVDTALMMGVKVSVVQGVVDEVKV